MTKDTSEYQLETLGVHAGLPKNEGTNAHALPIYLTNAYLFNSADHAANLFSLAEPGNIYTRLMNPTTSAFEERIAAMEGGVAALAVASGSAAITYAILNIAGAGDEIVSSANVYGGTFNLFQHTLPKYGVNTTFVDPTDLEAIKAAITPKTKAIYAETVGNPSLNVLDIEAVAAIAHAAGIPLIIDNTFASPYLCRPIEFGADIVVHSATKWIGGNGTAMGGVIVDGGTFDWHSDKFPGFTEPDSSYNGVVFADLGAPAFVTKIRVQLLRDTGAALSPFNAFLLSLGAETLHVRMKEHVANAQKLVEYLKNHPAVSWVLYPGSEDHPSYELAKKYLPKGAGSVVVFGIKGGRAAGREVINNVNLWSHVANVGDVKSLIIHPASTTHSQLSDEELKEAGVKDDLIRLSVGIENIDDIVNDLEQAIEKATGLKSRA
ncbi:O-acetylhomoserine aminocarboxypropyltransferase/cysteine synthase family protein [Massilibacterium senegalense]|uniref:O-acetylhomoserine aminocarboxypropyltransferase/cysteine synthase family protein n=1 Tax=Massilibacterium senegalense TaxID=1632858 RepID=UPI00078604EC|nr:O-acetylhomoserine aminocarboxypropyltransferase/cysteine synthase family protein [Massilibacterium senegalense]